LNDFERFPLGLKLSLPRIRPSIGFRATYLILTRKQGKSDRQERVALTPAKLKKAKTTCMPRLGMVKLKSGQFQVFGMGPFVPFVHRVIHNEHVLKRRIRQRFDKPNDPLTEQNQEHLPVDPAVIEQVAERFIQEIQLILMLQIITIRRLA
jgi:hypothetical protein